MTNKIFEYKKEEKIIYPKSLKCKLMKIIIKHILFSQQEYKIKSKKTFLEILRLVRIEYNGVRIYVNRANFSTIEPL